MRPVSVLIDPGHGGSDQAGHYSPKGLLEKDLALQLGALLGRNLTEVGFDVCFTRYEDDHITHRYRAKTARKYDLTLSLHFHTSGNPHVRNITAQARIEAGEVVGRLILDKLKVAIGETTFYRPTNARITTYTEKPVVVLQLGMLSHPEVEQSLIDGTRLPKLAAAICEGVAQHYGAVVPVRALVS